VPGLQHQVVAAGHRHTLAAGQQVVIEVAAAGHPQGPFAGQQPSPLRGHPALRVVHQYLFHDKLLFRLKSSLNHRCNMACRRMTIEAGIDTKQT